MSTNCLVNQAEITLVRCPHCKHLFIPIRVIDDAGKSVADSMTLRELMVIGWLEKGLSNTEIAEKMGWKKEQVAKNYLRRAYQKANVHSRIAMTQLIHHHPALLNAVLDALEFQANYKAKRAS